MSIRVIFGISSKNYVIDIINTLTDLNMLDYFSFIHDGEGKIINLKTQQTMLGTLDKDRFIRSVSKKTKISKFLDLHNKEKKIQYIDDNPEMCTDYNNNITVHEDLKYESGGINENHLINIENELNPQILNIIIFDFDCTLTKHHQFKTLRNWPNWQQPDNFHLMTDKERSLYFIGGNDRKNMLNSFFQKFS